MKYICTAITNIVKTGHLEPEPSVEGLPGYVLCVVEETILFSLRIRNSNIFIEQNHAPCDVTVRYWFVGM
jgi:hypothetical protein